MQGFYPEIYYPKELIDFNQNWRVRIEERLIPQSPEEPKEPEKLQVPKFEFESFLFPWILFGGCLYMFTKSFSTLCIATIVWFIIYITFYLKAKIDYPKKLIENKTKIAVYEKACNDYNNNLITRANEIEIIRDNLKDVAWAYNKRIEITAIITKPLRKAEIAYKNMKIGRSEGIFKKHLVDVFGESIKTDKVIEIFSYNRYREAEDLYDFDDFMNAKSDNAYVPDFIFEHPITELTIDIEIDEPYSNRKPIHYAGNTHDCKRNKYFSDQNWIIMRFSEFQIITDALACCREIAFIIQDLTGDKSFLNKFDQYNRIFRHKKWNYTEAVTFHSPSLKSDYFNSSILKIYTLDTYITGLWSCRGKNYLINNNEISEKLNVSGTDIVKFNATLKLEAYLSLTILCVESEEAKTKYIIESCDERNMLWTNIYSREYTYFTRLNN